MKIALISDTHGNLPALEAVLKDISRFDVDKVVCLGDIVTLGPSPREVLHLVRGLNGLCLVGNHEEAVFHPERALDYGIQGNLFSTIRWCADSLSPDDMAYLQTAIPTAKIEIEGLTRVVLYHGSPRSSVEGIHPETPYEKLDELFSTLDASTQVAAGGHTHVQMLKQHRSILIVNPGSVGCAFQPPLVPKQPPRYYPVAEYAILAIDADCVSVDLRQVRFDVRAFARAILDSTLPLKDWWSEQFTRLGTFET